MLEISDLESRVIELSMTSKVLISCEVAADMYQCFRIYAKSRFSHDATQI